jgi:predicted nucleic acid-binding protein
VGSLLYLDPSALVKLVVAEPESPALRELLTSWPERVSSVIAGVEVVRASRRVGETAARRANDVVAGVALVELDGEVLELAAVLEPVTLRTLDAIHLATALSLGGDLGAFCAYDARLLEVASSAGLEVLTPT